MVEFTLRDFLLVISVMTALALVLAAIGAAGLAVARWARARGRRPWIWVIGAYLAVNVAIGLIQLIARGAR